MGATTTKADTDALKQLGDGYNAASNGFIKMNSAMAGQDMNPSFGLVLGKVKGAYDTAKKDTEDYLNVLGTVMSAMSSAISNTLLDYQNNDDQVKQEIKDMQAKIDELTARIAELEKGSKNDGNNGGGSETTGSSSDGTGSGGSGGTGSGGSGSGGSGGDGRTPDDGYDPHPTHHDVPGGTDGGSDDDDHAGDTNVDDDGTDGTDHDGTDHDGDDNDDSDKPGDNGTKPGDKDDAGDNGTKPDDQHTALGRDDTETVNLDVDGDGTVDYSVNADPGNSHVTVNEDGTIAVKKGGQPVSSVPGTSGITLDLDHDGADDVTLTLKQGQDSTVKMTTDAATGQRQAHVDNDGDGIFESTYVLDDGNDVDASQASGAGDIVGAADAAGDGYDTTVRQADDDSWADLAANDPLGRSPEELKALYDQRDEVTLPEDDDAGDLIGGQHVTIDVNINTDGATQKGSSWIQG